MLLHGSSDLSSDYESASASGICLRTTNSPLVLVMPELHQGEAGQAGHPDGGELRPRTRQCDVGQPRVGRGQISRDLEADAIRIPNSTPPSFRWRSQLHPCPEGAFRTASDHLRDDVFERPSAGASPIARTRSPRRAPDRRLGRDAGRRVSGGPSRISRGTRRLRSRTGS
jgi:hypothetical protein